MSRTAALAACTCALLSACQPSEPDLDSAGSHAPALARTCRAIVDDQCVTGDVFAINRTSMGPYFEEIVFELSNIPVPLRLPEDQPLSEWDGYGVNVYPVSWNGAAGEVLVHREEPAYIAYGASCEFRNGLAHICTTTIDSADLERGYYQAEFVLRDATGEQVISSPTWLANGLFEVELSTTFYTGDEPAALPEWVKYRLPNNDPLTAAPVELEEVLRASGSRDRRVQITIRDRSPMPWFRQSLSTRAHWRAGFDWTYCDDDTGCAVNAHYTDGDERAYAVEIGPLDAIDDLLHDRTLTVDIGLENPFVGGGGAFFYTSMPLLLTPADPTVADLCDTEQTLPCPK